MPDMWTFLADQVLPGLSKGLWVSVKIIVPSSLLGALIGILTGTARVYGPRWIKLLANGYVAVFRGTPLVVQLYFWYFALPYLEVGGLRIVLSAMAASIIGFALCSGAYQSEYIRGGLQSIKQGQIKAASALGMSQFQAVLTVVMPQAVRRALPGCGNEIIYLIKYSSLASIITLQDLTGVGRSIAKATWRNIEVFAAVGVYYLVLVTVATLLLKWLETRLTIPGFEKSGGR